MITTDFDNYTFEERNDRIIVTYKQFYYFDFLKEDLQDLGEYKIENNQLIFLDDQKEKRINKVLNKLLTNRAFYNKFTHKQVYFIDKESEIPLMGHIAFGLIDRGTNIIEIRPNTGCNMNCPFCSVDEGLSTKKDYDYYVDPYYLAEEFAKLCKVKNADYIEAHIGPQGEPLTYDDLEIFIKEISKIKNLKIISINSNGTLMDEKRLDNLIEAGLNRVNLSLHSIDPKTSKKMFGSGFYNIEKIKEICKHIAEKIDLVIAPVMVKGYNETDLIEVINFAKELNWKAKFPRICIQNFLKYKYGRNPVKEIPWPEFYKLLEQYENETGVSMKISEADFNIFKCDTMEKTMKKNETVDATIVLPGRLKGEMVAVAKNRSISVFKAHNLKVGQRTKLKIIKNKHNLYTAYPCK